MSRDELVGLVDELAAVAGTDAEAALRVWERLRAHPDWPGLAGPPRLDVLDDVAAAYAGAGELDRAVATAREALDQTVAEDPDRPYRIAMLAQRVRERYEAGSGRDDLAWLVELSRAAVTESAAGAPELPMRLTALGGALRLRYAAQGDLADLDEAVRVFRRATKLAITHGADPAPHQNNLAVALSDRYDRTGQVSDLDGAVEAARRAVDGTPPGHPDRSMYLANLAVFLSDRYDRAGALTDLDEASVIALQASRDAAADDPGLPRVRNLLAALDLDRYERFGRADDLDRSIAWARAAVAGTPAGAPELPGYLNNLGNAARLRFEAALAAAGWPSIEDLELDVADLRQAVQAHRRAVELASEGSPDRPKFLTNLGNVLLDQAIVLPDEADLDAAVRALTDAVPDDAGSPHRAGRLNSLALALRARFDHTGDPDDRDQAIAAFRASCADGLATNVESALTAAENWRRWAAERRSWQETIEACEAGLQAARLLHGIQLLREHQLAWLRAAEGLSTTAALARCHVGDARGAVTAIDGGRALLLADALRRDRTDLSRLAAWAPALASRYAAAARAAADAERALGRGVTPALPVAADGRQTRAMTDPGVAAVRAARQELDAVIEEIRTVEGFEQFLAPPTFDDIARAADAVPLVYFAAADQGGLALIVRDGDATHVPLDGLTAERLRQRAEAHLGVYTEYRRDQAAGRQRWSDSLSEITRWLWTDAVGPVLDELAGTPAAVFVAGGLLGLLPLHAAWTEDPAAPTGRRYALDELIISYAPNARALQAARDLAETVPSRRLLAVVEPAPVPAGPLPYARYEAHGFIAAAGLDGRELAGREATPLRFQRHAADADVLLLACHGRAELAEPLRSGLLLAGATVTLQRLMELRLRLRLAVLSACETALPGTELPDEVIGLPTGLLQAGVAGVVASLWAVPDRATAMLITEFGRLWAGGRCPPAAALRLAQRWLRDTTNAQKREHWLAALEQQPALPTDVVEEFMAALAFAEPNERHHAGLPAWAAFAHLGA